MFFRVFKIGKHLRCYNIWTFVQWFLTFISRWKSMLVKVLLSTYKQCSEQTDQFQVRFCLVKYLGCFTNCMVFLFVVSDGQLVGARPEWLRCQVPGTRRTGIISLTPAALRRPLALKLNGRSGFLIPHFASALGPVFLSQNNGHVFHSHSLQNMNLFKIIQIKIDEFMYSSSKVIRFNYKECKIEI